QKKDDDEEEVNQGLVQSSADSRHPSYMFPVVDSAGLYVGAISRMQLVNLYDFYMEKFSQKGIDERRIQQKMHDRNIDVVRVCNSDGFAVNLPGNTSLADAMVLFECHRSNCFFITEHHRVIGRVDLNLISRMCDEKNL